jgi:hypothetical protein
MHPVSHSTFGPLIAYLVPGATVLAGLGFVSPAARAWFAVPPDGTPTIGGFLYLTLAALAAGMTVSAVRWALVDTLHAKTGLPVPAFNFANLGRNVEAFALLIRIHYEHYQFYANMLVATAVAYACYRVHLGGVLSPGRADLAFVLLEAVFFAMSRDTLRKYYTRGSQLLDAPGAASTRTATGERRISRPSPPGSRAGRQTR